MNIDNLQTLLEYICRFNITRDKNGGCVRTSQSSYQPPFLDGLSFKRFLFFFFSKYCEGV